MRQTLSAIDWRHQMIMRRDALRGLGGLVLVLGTAGRSMAQGTIAKPIRIISAYGAGLGPDGTVRVLAEKLSSQTGQPVVVDSRPGGNGLAFDWQLIRGWRWNRPWMLAGGLTPSNVAEAIRLTGAVQVDVASGVESRPGYKDAAKVAAFVRSASEAERLDA